GGHRLHRRADRVDRRRVRRAQRRVRVRLARRRVPAARAAARAIASNRRRGIVSAPMASDHDDDVPSLSRLLLLTADVFPPLAATTRADFAVRTRAGGSHSANEDHYLIMRLGRNQEALFTSLPGELVPRFDEYAYAMVVADGMGAVGELASRLAIAALVELAVRFGEWR